ncbi:MAG: nicotinamide riboside transporter PnuC [Bacteroidales bacterium]|jgi:nicotinamide mononucleotide transporter|nr:nicotinamide riboside transporter PnuC [Bacteroidales bacterium]
MELFSINHILFSLWGYDVCLLELLGTVLGVCSVWLATQGKAVNFLVGIVGMSFLTVFFYQKGLYSSSILQVILCCFCAFGYYNWTKSKQGERKKVTTLKLSQRMATLLGILAFVGIWGSVMVFAKSGYLEVLFPENYDPKILGYADALVLIVSILGMFLRTQKKIDNWYLFFLSDMMGIILYTSIGAYFVTMMCSIYWLLDIKAIISWRKELTIKN